MVNTALAGLTAHGCPVCHTDTKPFSGLKVMRSAVVYFELTLATPKLRYVHLPVE